MSKSPLSVVEQQTPDVCGQDDPIRLSWCQGALRRSTPGLAWSGRGRRARRHLACPRALVGPQPDGSRGELPRQRKPGLGDMPQLAFGSDRAIVFTIMGAERMR